MRADGSQGAMMRIWEAIARVLVGLLLIGRVPGLRRRRGLLILRFGRWRFGGLLVQIAVDGLRPLTLRQPIERFPCTIRRGGYKPGVCRVVGWRRVRDRSVYHRLTCCLLLFQGVCPATAPIVVRHGNAAEGCRLVPVLLPRVCRPLFPDKSGSGHHLALV